MNALQASSSGLRPTLGSRPFRVKGRCRKSARTESFVATSPGSDRPIASPVVRQESALLQQAMDGNSDAQEQIFARHGSKLRRIAFRILRNSEDAEDAVQDGLCRAFAKLQAFEGRSSFSTWLTRIVINSALMLLRRKNARREASLDEFLEGQPEKPRRELIAAEPNPEEICTSSEIRALIGRKVRQLPPGLRTALQLYDLDGRSSSDSMQALRIGQSAFKSRISRARRKVAHDLRESFQSPTCRLSAPPAINQQIAEA
jgi:RNA polymerase sigma-70 factor, ECF subfamily